MTKGYGRKKIPNSIEVKPDIYYFVKEGNYKAIHQLIQKSKLENETKIFNHRWSGWSALHRAAESGHTDISELLIRNGFDINERTTFGWHTPLHLALSNGWLETSLMLLELGANPNKKNKYNQTPVEYAVSRGFEEVAKKLSIELKAIESEKEAALASKLIRK